MGPSGVRGKQRRDAEAWWKDILEQHIETGSYRMHSRRKINFQYDGDPPERIAESAQYCWSAR